MSQEHKSSHLSTPLKNTHTKLKIKTTNKQKKTNNKTTQLCDPVQVVRTSKDIVLLENINDFLFLNLSFVQMVNIKLCTPLQHKVSALRQGHSVTVPGPDVNCLPHVEEATVSTGSVSSYSRTHCRAGLEN